MKKKGAISVYMKFPAGGESGWHTHDGDYEAVVIKGTVTHQVQGGTEKALGAGSYWNQPAKVNHRNGCKADSGECILISFMPKGFSFHPKTPEGKAPPAEKPAGK